MPHDTALLLTLAAAFAAAFVFGFGASKLGLPPLVGYLVAGMFLGPHSPGFVADVALAQQLAEIGVILLMFGVGLHFSPGDFMRVRRIALPGAAIQMIIAGALGLLLARSWAWSWPAATVFGLSLSVASTVVVLKTLEGRGLLDSLDGRVAVGWLVVEDLGVIIALVLLPVVLGGMGASEGIATAETGSARFLSQALGFTGGSSLLALQIGLTLLKVVAFILIMGLVGRRAVPWLLTRVAKSGSRELFTLSVLAVSLGVAVVAASIFGVSFALGAFVAGVVISESDLSHRAGADALPMQDAFAVLFFVSVGMLIDPSILLTQPLKVAAAVGIVWVGNGIAAAALMVLLRHPLRQSLRLGASLGQIGEFSFILAGLGVSIGVLSEEGRSLVLAAALVTIVLNPLFFRALDGIGAAIARAPKLLVRLERQREPRMMPTDVYAVMQPDHAILVGYGRVGRTIGDAMQRMGVPFVAIESERRVVEAMRTIGVPAIYGDATQGAVFEQANAQHAKLLVIATPEPYHARHIISMARSRNPGIEIIVRTHSDEEQTLFERLGVSRAMMGERELAFGMAYHSLRSLGCDDD
ncbi:MAG TPA: cation:proton antiporter, partial [Gemmatimonadaceae bacterium]|nr:cation:proton antiporter [Gemmatimonadaceae bacterium]